MFKKIVNMALFFSLALPGLSYANDNSNLSREQQEQYVITNYGISPEFAKDLKESDLKKFVSQKPVQSTNKEEYFRIESTTANNSLRSTDAVAKPVVTKISKEQALAEVEEDNENSEISTLGNSNSKTTTVSWLKLETNMTYYKTSGAVSVYATWLKTANYTKLDILAIGLSENVAPKNGTASFSHKLDWYNPIDSTWSVMNGPGANISYHPGGASAKFNLATPSVQAYKNERAYLSLTVVPREGGSWKALSYYDTLGYYRHQETIFTVSPSISIPKGGSLGLSSADSFADVDSFAQIQYK